MSALDTLTVCGRRAWSARQIGAALGRDPGTFAASVVAFDLYVEGTDYAVLPDGTVALFDAGVRLAASRYPAPAATALRQALTAGFATCEAADGATDPEPLCVATLLDCATTGDATDSVGDLVRAEAVRSAARARFAVGEIDAHELAAWELHAAELALGRELDALRGPIPRGWSTPTQIAHRLGVSAHRVGRAITALGLRRSGRSARPRIFTRDGDALVAWIYAGDAERQIAEHLASRASTAARRPPAASTSSPTAGPAPAITSAAGPAPATSAITSAIAPPIGSLTRR